MVDYIIRAAVAEETNDGWIWICGPSQNLDSRTVVVIKRPGDCRVVYTEVRRIDRNFLLQYNSDANRIRINIDSNRDTIVMAEWYRRALAIRSTTKPDNNTDTVSLSVKKAKIWGWRSLRAACHHPDPVVRVGTRLGVLGVWLGLLGVWLGLLGVYAASSFVLGVGWFLVVIPALLGVGATWGPPRSRLG